jgi:hypothetical protein
VTPSGSVERTYSPPASQHTTAPHSNSAPHCTAQQTALLCLVGHSPVPPPPHHHHHQDVVWQGIHKGSPTAHQHECTPMDTPFPSTLTQTLSPMRMHVAVHGAVSMLLVLMLVPIINITASYQHSTPQHARRTPIAQHHPCPLCTPLSPPPHPQVLNAGVHVAVSSCWCVSGSTKIDNNNSRQQHTTPQHAPGAPPPGG